MIFGKKKSFNAKLIKTASNMQLVHLTFFTKHLQKGLCLYAYLTTSTYTYHAIILKSVYFSVSSSLT